MHGAEGFPSELCAEHRAVEALLRRLDGERARGRPAAEEDLRLLHALRLLLAPHLTAEEVYLYPLVRRRLPAGGALADAAAHTHATIRGLLDRAVDERLSAPERGRATAALTVVLRAHLRGEEERLFPALRARVAPEELRRCARRLREARPTGPDAPVWGLPPGTGAIAAVRDGLTGHDTARSRHSP
ncbi:hemerythrin domain-containing protein [Kitasatospora sp. CM 4170]|uniref:Hemerythrin domain-containing protein n=1 Tax=Kitasatospora aburaviensis TaxID=67265 RepID=A0ABW1F003_9ACTN|nr:hemerythrin domain-containing protein [Kitasatospora sp. CM 4170]WNM43548.1 hemerythrin domain-containing protein [Kitasatospora sp. CM 4170]